MTYHLKDLGDGRIDLVQTREVSLGVLTDRPIAERFVEFLNLTATADQVFAELDADPMTLAMVGGSPELEAVDDQPADGAASDGHLKSGQPWSDKDVAELMRLHDRGMSHVKIAESLRRPLEGTRFRLKKELAARREEFELQNAHALTETQAALMQHVSALDAEYFTPDDDLLLFGAMTTGVPVEVIADQLGCETTTVSARWFVLLPESVVTSKGKMTVQGAEDMLAVLKARVAGAR